MKLTRFLFSFIFLIALSVQIFSQYGGAKEKKTILLDKKKPSVYLEFVKTGQCTKDFSNFNWGNLCNSKSEFANTFNAFWVRITNNTRWSIGLTVDKGATESNSTPVMIDSTEFVDDDGETKVIGKMLANNGAEMDVVYKSEAETGCDFSAKAPKGQPCKMIEVTLPKISLAAISTDLFIASGESVIFPVDFKHIKKYVDLYVLYNFEWEYSGQFFSHTPHYYMQHRAYFGWFALEKGVKQEAEKKQKKSAF